MSDRISQINSLSTSYGVANSLTSFDESLESAKILPPIGAEIELAWSSVVPQLKGILSGEKYSNLPMNRKTAFDFECDSFAKQNLEKYTRTQDFGIPRGKDGFYEFAFKHAYWHKTASEEIGVLYRAGLIPENNPHPLHVTIGGFTRDANTGIALCALELLGHTSQDRLNQAFSPTIYKSAWNRKGVCGIHEKWRVHLADGYLSAVELRTLFASSPQQVGSLLRSVQMLFYGMEQAKIDSGLDAAQEWLAVKSLVVNSVLKPHSLNKWWEGPHDGNDSQWQLFTKLLADPQFDNVRTEISSRVDSLENMVCDKLAQNVQV